MPIRNQNWYNLQATRRYPLDDKSTGISDDGGTIREDIIVDCHIRFAPTLGEHIYVQGINVSQNLVTVVLGAATALAAPATACGSVAVVSIPQPVTPGVNYAVQPLQPGIVGWITFGPGVDTNFVGRYSTPAQTFIHARNARPYYELPVPTLGKLGVGTALAGLVGLTADNPVTATYYENYAPPQYDPETDEIDDEHPVRAIVFSTISPTAEFNPYERFLGPCGQRPESGNCPSTPIERINGLPPDCNTGNINIVVGPGLTARPFADCGGLDITTPKKLSVACANEPKSEKKRADECCDYVDGESEFCWATTNADSLAGEDEQLPVADVPVAVSFRQNCRPAEPTFAAVTGLFAIAQTLAPPDICQNSGDPPSVHDVLLSQSATGHNTYLYRAYASDWAYNTVVSVEFKPRTARDNGGVILNRVRVVENGATVVKYIAAVYDARAEELQIWRYNGKTLIKEAQVSVPYIAQWYKISVYATPSGSEAAIVAQLYAQQTGAVIATLATTIQDYEAVNGRVGLIARAANTYFNKFEVQAIA